MNTRDYSWRIAGNDLSILSCSAADLEGWVERLLWVTNLSTHEWVRSDIKVPLNDLIVDLAARAGIHRSRVLIGAVPVYGNCEGIIVRLIAIAGDHCTEFLTLKMFCAMAKAFDVARELAMTIGRVVMEEESPAVLKWAQDLGHTIHHHQRLPSAELQLERSGDALTLKQGGRETIVARGETVQWLIECAKHDVALLAATLQTTWRYAEAEATARAA